MEKRTSFKNLSTQDKFAYIWDYYKGPIIAVLCVVFLISNVVKTIANHKDPTLAVLMINSSSKETTFFDDIIKGESEDALVLLNATLGFSDAGITMGNYLDDTVLSAHLNNSTFDLFFGTGEKFNYVAEEGFLIDLRDILSKESFESIPEDDLIYSTANGHTEKYPCAVKIKSNLFTSIYYPDSEPYCGVVYNDPNPEVAGMVIEKLLSLK